MKKLLFLMLLAAPALADIAVTPGVGKTVATETNNSREYQTIELVGPGGTSTMTVVSGGASVGGPAASGASAAGNPLQDGRLAQTSLPTAVSNAQMVASLGDKFGRTVTIADCPRDLIVSTNVVLSASTSETLLLSSGTAGVFNDLIAIIVSNSGATASLVTVRSGGFGTTLGALHFIAPTAGTNVGAALPHIWPQQSSATDWTVQGASSSSSIYVDAIFCANH